MDITNLITLISQLNWLEILGAVTALLLALITIFEMIPGDQPEKALRKVVEILARFSRK